EAELEQYQFSLSIAGKNGSTIEILLVFLLWLEYQDVPMAVEGEDAATAAPVEGISSVVLFGWKAIVNKGLGQGRGEKSGSAYNGGNGCPWDLQRRGGGGCVDTARWLVDIKGILDLKEKSS
ncbi:hypothetical protein B296_00031568, partial [Ensete ventricosum]